MRASSQVRADSWRNVGARACETQRMRVNVMVRKFYEVVYCKVIVLFPLCFMSLLHWKQLSTCRLNNIRQTSLVDES